jgi:hypothetical protein
VLPGKNTTPFWFPAGVVARKFVPGLNESCPRTVALNADAE